MISAVTASTRRLVTTAQVSECSSQYVRTRRSQRSQATSAARVSATTTAVTRRHGSFIGRPFRTGAVACLIHHRWAGEATLRRGQPLGSAALTTRHARHGRVEPERSPPPYGVTGRPPVRLIVPASH